REPRAGRVREFFGRATQHMRWQLNDLARRLDQESVVRGLDAGAFAAAPSSASGLTPDAARMLGANDELPEDEREAFNLVRIQGLTYPEAADVLGVAVKTVQRRLTRARLLLAKRLADLRPDTSASGDGPGDTPKL